jgi:hypothetical protein
MQATSVADDEKRQMQLTIQVLRDQIELLRLTGEERVERAVLAADEERRQLQRTIQALRDFLERTRAGHP